MTVALFAALCLLQLADIITTRRVLAAGGRELNPIMAKLMAEFGVLPALLVVKGVFCALVAHYLDDVPAWVLAALCVGYVAVVVNNWRLVRRG